MENQKTTVDPIEYSINTKSLGLIHISEFDMELIPQLIDEEIASSLKYVLDRCMRMNREDVEALKLGHDKPFRNAIRSPTTGLMRVSPNVCRVKSDCSMYNKQVCTTSNIDKKGLGLFPVCWEFDSELKSEKRVFAQTIGTAIVCAWRSGRYCILVDNSI